MDLKLTVVFTNLRVKGFTIMNPPSVPSEGEVVTMAWEDFVKDPKDIEMIRNAERQSRFFAHVGRHFEKDLVEVYVMLCDEDQYFKNIARLKAGSDDKEDPVAD